MMKTLFSFGIFVFVGFLSFQISAAQTTEEQPVDLNVTTIAELGLDDETNTTSNSSEETSTLLIGFTTEPEWNTTELFGLTNETVAVEIDDEFNTTLNATEEQGNNATELEAEPIHVARTQPLHLPPGQDQHLAETPAPENETNTTEESVDEEATTELSTDETTEEQNEDERETEEEIRRREEEEIRRRQWEEAQQAHQHESHDLQDPDADHARPEDYDPRRREPLPPKQSVQATFKFTSEKRCFDFLKRLKGKGRNEHSDHPLTCPEAFDGILCWRPADPGETLLQVCPDVPRQRKSYAKRHCEDGKWQEYPNANEKLQLRDILTTSYEECYQVPAFLRKHGGEAYRPAYTSAEQLGPGAFEYRHEATPSSVAATAQVTALYSYVQAPKGEVATTVPSQDNNSTRDGPPARPWLASNDQECQNFLNQHNLGNTRGGNWCPGVSDGKYCWPATAPNSTPTQPCRRAQTDEELTNGLIPNVSRHCNADGQWIGSNDVASWTNTDECDKVTPTRDNLAVAGLGGHFLVTGETTTLLSTVEESATGSPMALTSNPENDSSRHKPRMPWLQSTKESCEQLLKDIGQLDETQPGSCRGGTDGNICWPTTVKDQTLTQPCPKIAGLDSTKNVSRTCGSNGAWSEATGNYADCFTPEIKDLIKLNCVPKTSSGTVFQSMPWIIASFFVLTLNL